MSDGTVALILDVAGLARIAHTTDTTVRLSETQIEKPNVAATVDVSVAKVVVDEVTVAEENDATEEPEYSPVGADA